MSFVRSCFHGLSHNVIRMPFPTSLGRSDVRRAWLADLGAIVLFVVVGRRNHNEGTALHGIASVAAPFLIGLVVGWLAAVRVDPRPFSVRFGAVVWVATLAVGMVLRSTAFNRGTATPFVIVATVFLGLTLLGWRIVVDRRSRRSTPSP